MSVDMRGKDLISLHDLTREEIEQIIDLGAHLKLRRKAGDEASLCKGKTLGMIFTKASTRTRVSFEVAMFQLGGHALYLSSNDLQLKRGETIADTARVLSRYLDGIMIRTFDHKDVTDLAQYAGIPVINGLTDLLHPCQILADLLTIKEKKNQLEGMKLAYVGDGNNVTHSLLFGCSKVGMDVAVATPEGYEPNKDVVKLAKEDAAASGSTIEVGNDAYVAVDGADVIYTDTWASMGQEAEHDKRVKIMKPFQVNPKLIKAAKKDCLFMHCLPAHRGEEVTDEVADGSHSVIFDEAENRLHVQKAILALLL
ncbi:MAG TPA: ornithine carbamoyltransferase [Bacillota bacterium]|jgi:ornithine carbamoyltransferase